MYGYDEGGHVNDNGTDNSNDIADVGYQGGGEIRLPQQRMQQAPTHVTHNNRNQRMIADHAKRDLPRAAHLLQGLRRQHNGLRAMATAALAHTQGLRDVGRHELGHGHDAHALHMLNMAHAHVPDGAELHFSQHGDHDFNARVKRNGRVSDFPLNRNQLLQFAMGPAGGFDHSIDNGVEKNLTILSRGPRGRAPGYQGGGEVEGYTGDYNPSMDVYQDPDQGWVRRALDYARQSIPNIRDYLNPTTENSATADQINQAQGGLGRGAPTVAPAPPTPDVWGPFPGTYAPGERPQPVEQPDMTWFRRPTAPAPTPPADQIEQRQRELELNIPPVLRGGRRAVAEPERSLGELEGETGTRMTPRERFAEYGEPAEFDVTQRMPGAKHLEQYEPPPGMGFAGLPEGPEARQRAARQEYITRMMPQWEKEAAWFDQLVEDQVRKGLIKPGDMPRNIAQEQKAQRWPMGGGSESRGLYPDEATKDMRNWERADRSAADFDNRLVSAMNAKRALGGNVEEIPSVGPYGTFKTPLAREPQARDVVPSDRLGRSRAGQAEEGVRPRTQFEPGFMRGPGGERYTPRPEEYGGRQWMEGPTPPYQRPAWQPPVAGVGPPPPRADMSPEAVAARRYPWASQGQIRRNEETRIREGIASAEAEREERTSKERIAQTAAEGKISAAEARGRATVLAAQVKADAAQAQELGLKDAGNALYRARQSYMHARDGFGDDESKWPQALRGIPENIRILEERVKALQGGKGAGAETGETRTPAEQQQSGILPGKPPTPQPGNKWREGNRIYGMFPDGTIRELKQ